MEIALETELATPPTTSAYSASTVYMVQLPFLTRINYWVRLRFFQLLVSFAFFIRRLPVAQQATYTKRYSVLPGHPARVFIPRSYKAGDRLLPLFIDIHGGGFNICDPRVDDKDNAILSHKHGICVVSIGYRKGPGWKWPTAPKDCAALIAAVLNDEDLPVDKANIAIGGYSAGANLALTAVQLDGLYEKVKGVVAYYAPVDLSRDKETKLAYSKLAPGRKADMLLSMSPLLAYGYLPAGTDLRDPIVSPIFAQRSKLPKKLCFIGCEYDWLCGEAKDMAEQVAKHESEQRITSQGGNAWDQGGIRWEMLPGLEHGFNSIPPGKDPVVVQEKRRRTEAMHQNVSDWLYKEVYA